MKKIALLSILVFALLFVSQAQYTNIDSGLVAYYPFNGNDSDMSNSNNKPIANTATLTDDRIGNANSAYYFNGINSYIQIANNSSINFNQKMSICVWVKPMGFYKGLCYNNMIISKGITDNFGLNAGNYSMRFADYVNGCNSLLADTTKEYFYGPNGGVAVNRNVRLNRWYFLVYTTDGTTGKLYINNKLCFSGSAGNILSFTNAYDLFFGKMNNANYPYWFNGVMDDIRLYNRDLNRDEVRVLYNASPTPIIKGNVFVDLNSNGIKDSNDYAKPFEKVSLSTGDYTFTDIHGNYELDVDSTGTHVVFIDSSKLFVPVPPSDTIHFTSNDTTAISNFILQPNATPFDSINVKVIPLFNAARPGFRYPCVVFYENVGNTVLNSALNFKYDSSILTYDSSSANYILYNWNLIYANSSVMYPGQRNAFLAYFTVKQTAHIGDTLRLIATVTGNSAGASDSIGAIIRGSFDPNSKEATPVLTVQEVQQEKDVIYTIRFENVGNDTAFKVSISDTLSNLLQTNTLTMISSSHPCKVYVNNNILRFDFNEINLPDTSKSKMLSNGFVQFKVKPKTTLTAGMEIPNKASIYFDYNAPVVTNTAKTYIKNVVTPINLSSFTAKAASNNKSVAVQWQTANEINTIHFNVQRSTDNRNFVAVGKVEAKGSGNTYLLTDDINGITAKQIYYRLQSVDADNLKQYSRVVSVKLGTTAKAEIFPNPTRNYIVLTRNSNNAEMIIISDLNGKSVLSQQVAGYQAQVNINKLAEGIYILQTQNGDRIMFIKQ